MMRRCVMAESLTMMLVQSRVGSVETTSYATVDVLSLISVMRSSQTASSLYSTLSTDPTIISPPEVSEELLIMSPPRDSSLRIFRIAQTFSRGAGRTALSTCSRKGAVGLLGKGGCEGSKARPQSSTSKGSTKSREVISVSTDDESVRVPGINTGTSNGMICKSILSL